MEPESEHLRHRREENEELESTHSSTTKEGSLEFETPEEMIKHDANQHTPPPEIESRLKRSLGEEPKVRGSWWKRLFS